MSNSKAKTECYTNLAGINAKYSPYIMSTVECLNLINFDFQTPGAWSQRWGSTQYIGQTFAGSINALFEFSRLNGFSTIVVGVTGGIWAGATQTNLTGMSFPVLGATQTAGVLSFAAAGVIFNGNPISPAFTVREIPFDVLDPLGGFILATGATVYLDPVVMADDTLSVSIQNDFMFMADANKFLKFDGVTTTMVSLPYVSRSLPAGISAGFSLLFTNSNSTASWPVYGGSGAINGFFYSYMTYVNDRGFEGPLTPMALIQGLGSDQVVGGAGGSFIHYAIEVATPLQYGISAINQYVFFIDGTGASLAVPTSQGGFPQYGATISPLVFDPIFLSTTPASGTTFTWVNTGVANLNVGSSFAPVISNLGSFYEQNNYLPIGGTFQFSLVGQGFQQQSEYDLINYWPRFLTSYQNRLFLSGFSSTPSTVWFSDSVEPEGYAADFNFEVRTNDSDVISCMQAYASWLYIFKQNSFFVLTGDNPNNFVLQQVSNIYGALNDRSSIVFENVMFFLDSKGVFQYSGAQISNLSIKMQPYFDRMNLTAALVTASMIHDKLRNQIMIAIPIDGSTVNNITLVYDYVALAWTTYEGFTPSVFQNMQGINHKKMPFYGDVVGRVNQFSPSLIADNGVGMTTYFRTIFHHDLGESIEKQYRRLYINKDPGETMACAVNFYQDFGPSIVLSETYIVGTFQERFDYGIAAAALSFELYALPQIQPLRIYGYTLEQRLQRMVSR